jgi:transcriptional regulator with XRE-family HTH domain
MVVGEKLRDLRTQKNLSQGDIEKRTGLLRCYISRVENGHTIPAVETLEKFARALEVPIYQLFYEGEEPPKLPKAVKGKGGREKEWGESGKEAKMLQQFIRLFSRAKKEDLKLLLSTAQKMAGAHRHHHSAQ